MRACMHGLLLLGFMLHAHVALPAAQTHDTKCRRCRQQNRQISWGLHLPCLHGPRVLQSRVT